ncbi:beta strand repeat-containing protein [Croceivirga thetidis]|uniref:Uncharacterized protein n=1 Tax=Croceivirga thetidis TaxID=2721623 RepID=A0ABX1GL60_9FLAO|nr:hypothetical protein [Croceivirga thetidis]NKI30334.1 hypothetical protein [Croceivirga thetidis]
MSTISKSLALLFVFMVIISCSKDTDPEVITPDDNPTATCSDGIQNGDELGVDCGGTCSQCVSDDPSDLGGTITEEFTLDSSITYTLGSSLVVRSGGTLIIPAGTRIQAESGSSNHILVEQGGDIAIEGTEQNPVIMELKPGSSGFWGGLVIAGNAPVTSGESTSITGSTTTFGGNEPADNSGSISYLIIRNAGSTSSSSEIGRASLALYGLGTATTIDHVAIFDTQGDALSIYGGNNTTENIYIENASRNALVWNEGWSGTIANSMAVNTNLLTAVVSANGENNLPNLSNFTAISEQSNTAFQFFDQSGANITGLALIGFEKSFELFDAVTNANVAVNGEDVVVDLPYIAQARVDQTDFGWAGQLTTIDFVTVGGDITSDTTLEASSTYFLTGSLSVKEGATLTIDAGTEIIADVENGNSTNTFILVEQGARIEVSGTAQNPVVMKSSNGRPGDWGGLILAGNATTSAGVNATAEVGEIQYGGTTDNDDSGTINHLVLQNTGAKITENSEYNGLTLYAVGSGTTINNVAVIDGSDDGIELFGGTVSVSNLYLENIQDDSIDWTEGWNGSITNALIVHTIENFSTAVEADGINANPELNNITCISEHGGTAMQFKNDSGAEISNLSLLGYGKSFDVPNSSTIANISLDGNSIDTDLPYIASPTVDSNLFDWVSDKVQVNSMAITGELMSDLELNPEVTYYLDGVLSVEAGNTLTIPAGTQIIADVEGGEETATYIVVQRDAQISINGTSESPVLMTSSNKEAGDWGGLIIAGNGITSIGVDIQAEVGNIVYGGSNNADSSGNVNYLQIEYAGALINPESQYNGLSLYAVGSGTTLANIAILNGNDDGIEFFGGAVAVENLYLKNNADDSIDWTEEWAGGITNAYIEIGTSFSSALEAEGNQSRPTLTNVTAISSMGGNALAFKQNSGATIESLSLDGFNTSLIMVDGAPLANVNINGEDADPNDDYEVSSSLDMSLFSWVAN